MKAKDFETTKRVLKDSRDKNTYNFCECCLNANPEMKDGYTSCCNELSISKSEVLLSAKREDVQNFLERKWSISSHLQGTNRNNIVFKLEKKNKKFSINMNYDIDYIIERVSLETKGLRKDK